MHYLLFCVFSVYASKKLVKFEKIEAPEGKEPFFSTDDYDFYKIGTNDDKIFYYQSIPFLIESVKDLKAIFFEDLGLFEPFNKITVNNQIYTFDYSYIAGDIYFQAYSKGFFKKEYFYVAFKGSLENLSYNKVGNLLEVKGIQFLRVMDGYETIGICKKI